MNFSLHYTIKNFKSNNCLPNTLDFFLFCFVLFLSFLFCFFVVVVVVVVVVFFFLRNLQDSIQMPDITKRNSNCSFHSRKYWPCVM